MKYKVMESKGLVSNKENKSCKRLCIVSLIAVLGIVTLVVLLICFFPTDLIDFHNELVNYTKADEIEITTNKTIRFLINPVNICLSPDRIKLVVLISSLPENKNLRNTIRDTWGYLGRNKKAIVRIAFIIGNSAKNESIQRQIRKENWLNRDIILLNTEDNELNHISKTAAMLRWAADYCANAEYMLKAEDNMFIDLNYLLQTLTKEEKYKNGTIFIGPYHDNQKSSSDDLKAQELEDAFHALNLETMPHSTTLTYVIGQDAVKLLNNFLSYGMELPIINENILRSMGIHFMKDKRLRKHPAPQMFSDFNGYISACGYEPLEMRSLWQQFVNNALMRLIELDATDNSNILC